MKEYLLQSDPTWPPPNLILLNNALKQTGWQGGVLTEWIWREAVRKRLQNVNWDNVLADVRPFLEPGSDLSLLTYDQLEKLLNPN